MTCMFGGGKPPRRFDIGPAKYFAAKEEDIWKTVVFSNSI